MATFIDVEDLHEDDFLLVQSGNIRKLRTKQKLPDASTILNFTLNQPNSDIATFVDGGGNRRKLYLQNSFGYIHLDFYPKIANKGNTNSFYLPAGSPVPINLIEVQTFDGGTIWLDANTREVRWSNLTIDQRYIVDLIGFFRNN